MSRILKRPMFKTGGSTNEGIMHGLVDRRGYDQAGIVSRAKQLTPQFEELYREFTPKTRFPLGSIGLNLASGEFAGAGNVQNIVRSLKGPYEAWTAADDAREASIRRGAADLGLSTAMKEFDKLTKDERLEVEKVARLAFEAGEFPSYEAALSEFLKAKIYSKSGYYRPDVQERITREQREADIADRAKEYRSGSFPDSSAIANAKATFDIDRANIVANNPDLQFDPVNPFVDVAGKQTSYNEGFVYFNPADGKYYLYNGLVDGQPNFDPVEINLG